MKYRKKPVVIEAFKWTGDIEQTENPEWCILKIKCGDIYFTNEGTVACEMKITTLEGIMTAQRGDWIIQGIKGECYPCKPDIFQATYEPVKEPPHEK